MEKYIQLPLDIKTVMIPNEEHVKAYTEWSNAFQAYYTLVGEAMGGSNNWEEILKAKRALDAAEEKKNLLPKYVCLVQEEE